MPNNERDALIAARDALEEIALAGMSGSGQESEEGMRDWHARRAWEFIGIAARALGPIKAALAATAPNAGTPLGPTEERQRMTASRASFFMTRFLREEKLLGPNEQAALHFVIDALAAAPAQQAGSDPLVARLPEQIKAQAEHWACMAEIDNTDAAEVTKRRHAELVDRLAAQQAGAPLSRQQVVDRFSFLEGLVGEDTYRKIADTAVEIQRSAGAPLPLAPSDEQIWDAIPETTTFICSTPRKACMTYAELRQFVGALSPQQATLPASEPVAMTEEWWYDLASRHATKDWNGAGYLTTVKALVNDALSAQPQADAAEPVAKWIDDPHDIEQGQMLNPAWLKLHGLTAQQAQAPGARGGT